MKGNVVPLQLDSFKLIILEMLPLQRHPYRHQRHIKGGVIVKRLVMLHHRQHYSNDIHHRRKVKEICPITLCW